MKVQVLKIPSQPILRVGHHTMADLRESGNEQAGLVDLILVCEDKTEIRTESEVFSGFENATLGENFRGKVKTIV